MFDIAVHAFQNSPPRLEPPKEGAFYGALLLLMGPIEVFKIISISEIRSKQVNQ